MRFAKKFILLSTILCWAFISKAQWALNLKSHVELRTWTLTDKVEKGEKGLLGASIVLTQDSKIISQSKSESNGDFTVLVPPNGDFILTVSYPGCNAKKFSINTKGVPEEVAKENFKPSFSIGGFVMAKPFPGINYSGLQQSLVSVEYTGNGKKFDSDDNATENGLNIVTRIAEAENDLINDFCNTNKAGDVALAKPDCPLAKTLYEKAMSIIPGEQYPIEQLKKVELCLKNKALEEQKAKEAAAAKAAADLAAKEQAAKLAAEQKAAAEAKKEADQKAALLKEEEAKLAKEKAAKEQAEKAAADAANKAAAETAAKEQAAKLAAEQKAAADAKKEAEQKAALLKEEEAKLAKEKAAKEQAEKAAADAANKAAAETAAKEQAAKLAAEQKAAADAKKEAEQKAALLKEQEAKLAKEKAATDAANKTAADLAAKEQAAKLAAEQKASADAKKEADQKEALLKEQEVKLAKEKAAKEQAEKAAAEAANKTAAEAIAKEQATKIALEQKAAADAKKEADQKAALLKEQEAKLAKEKAATEAANKAAANLAAKEQAAKLAAEKKAAANAKKETAVKTETTAVKNVPAKEPEKIISTNEGSSDESKTSTKKRDSDYSIPQVLGLNKYTETIKTADGYFKMKRYAEAKVAYTEALTYKANDPYATGKLAAIEKLVATPK